MRTFLLQPSDVETVQPPRGPRRRLTSAGWAKYDLYAVQSFPLYRILQRDDHARFVFRTSEHAARATEPVEAHYLVQGMSYHSYGYFFGGERYWFNWESGYDDMHRALSGVPVTTWYDLYEQGDAIDVLVNPANPLEHCFVDERLAREITWYVYGDPKAID